MNPPNLMTSRSLTKVAEEFWQRTGGDRSFPCNLESGVLWILPLAIVRVPRLQTQSVRDWLCQNGIAARIIPTPDRPLRACIVASRGCGIVFLDGLDGADEQRMSLAHEVAHFILDYLIPRDRAIDALGPSILDVLDGDRPATPAERLSAVLRGVPIGVFSRLWHRGPAGGIEESGTLDCEDAAEGLALELLAPRREALRRIRRSGIDATDQQAIADFLRKDFDLPRGAARSYAVVLSTALKPTPTMRSWLGIDRG